MNVEHFHPGGYPVWPNLKSRRTRIFLIAGTLSLVFLVATAVRPMRVSAHSMENTLCDGQLVLVRTLDAWFHAPSLFTRAPQRGDIVVLRVADPGMFSSGQDSLVIKRIIGLAGDRIRIVRGVVFVNGSPLNEPYVHHDILYQPGADSWPQDITGAGQRDVVVPGGSLFVLGDNRGQSRDSRLWGPMPQGNVVGYLLFKLGFASRTGARCSV
ncbi:MAG TPA: signal peptidase I [Candidatus Angelobacter sp.]